MSNCRAAPPPTIQLHPRPTGGESRNFPPTGERRSKTTVPNKPPLNLVFFFLEELGATRTAVEIDDYCRWLTTYVLFKWCIQKIELFPLWIWFQTQTMQWLLVKNRLLLYCQKQNLKSIQPMIVMLIKLWYHVLENRLLIGSMFWSQGVLYLDVPGSCTWLIPATYKWFVYCSYNPLILTFDPNFQRDVPVKVVKLHSRIHSPNKNPASFCRHTPKRQGSLAIFQTENLSSCFNMFGHFES